MHPSGSAVLPSVHGRALMWLSAAVVATVAWLGINALFPALQPTGIPFTIVRLVIHAVILGGLWLALERSSIAPGRRVAVWLALAIPFTLWLIAIWILAVDGTFVSRPGVIPRLPLAIFLPIIIGLSLLLASRRVTAILIAAPASWLIALQCYRALGGTFLVGWAQGDIPGAFALPAGLGDVLVGLLALPVAAYVHAGAPRAPAGHCMEHLGRPRSHHGHHNGRADVARTATASVARAAEHAARRLSDSDDPGLHRAMLDPAARAVDPAAAAQGTAAMTFYSRTYS